MNIWCASFKLLYNLLLFYNDTGIALLSYIHTQLIPFCLGIVLCCTDQISLHCILFTVKHAHILIFGEKNLKL